MSYSIITHDGKAHMDDVLAAALLRIHKGEAPLSIERIPSSLAARRVEEGKTGPDIYYLDCGLVFDPARNLFDHHQGRDVDSTVFLVLRTFFPGLEGTELHDYVKLVSRVDTMGPKSLNDFDVIDESRFYFTMGQKLILKAFESDPLGVSAQFAAGISDNMAFEKEKAKAREWLSCRDNTLIEEVGGCKILHFKKRPPTELITPLRAVDDELVDKNGIHLIYSFDDRDESARTLYRTYHGHEMLDLTHSHPETLHFCHQSGFLMKFTPTGGEEWVKLVKEALLNVAEE